MARSPRFPARLPGVLRRIAGERAMALEKRSYSVVEQAGDFEIRDYTPAIVAETLVDGDFEKVGNEAFRRLAGYIGGRNRVPTSISLSAPVAREPGSRKIPMTAPVTQEAAGERYRLTFLMPSRHCLETLPEPLDARVTLRKEPGGRFAVNRYRGRWSRARYETKRDELLAFLRDRGVEPVGNPIWSRFDPPFMPWFLRHNEVMVRLAP